MAIRFFIPFQNYNTQNYHLKISYRAKKTSITMATLGGEINTDQLVSTIPVLTRLLPNIYTSECFNEAGLPFSVEVRYTEIGHLFEHILLEYLCSTKLSLGYQNVEFTGVTRWNWKRNPRGMFHIDISAKTEDRIIFNEALKKTIILMDTIFKESRQSPLNSFYYNQLSLH